ncbi:MAG: hypothetical protein RMJ52_08475 [Gemmataceae bacterium]|nr:hypothetical protein [Gemmataceae bacterium]
MKPSPPPRKPIGIRCPRCGGGRFKTTHTEPLSDERIRRRKKCLGCGRRVVTFEAILTPTTADGHM